MFATRKKSLGILHEIRSPRKRAFVKRADVRYSCTSEKKSMPDAAARLNAVEQRTHVRSARANIQPQRRPMWVFRRARLYDWFAGQWALVKGGIRTGRAEYKNFGSAFLGKSSLKLSPSLALVNTPHSLLTFIHSLYNQHNHNAFLNLRYSCARVRCVCRKLRPGQWKCQVRFE